MIPNEGVAPNGASSGDRLDVILPLASRDFDRAERLLLPSLRHFFTGLGTCWVVVPDADVAGVAACLDDPRLRVIGEDALIPELRWFRRPAVEGGSASGPTGWFIQQLIKLSIARVVTTSFYLTLDADVLCCRAVSAADLTPNGRALAVMGGVEVDDLGKWYERSAEVLDLPRATRAHGVTPVVLSKPGVLALFDFLEERLRPNALRAEALLLSHLPWREYTLYFTYLEHAGLFERYHVTAPVRTYGNNIWSGQDAESWDPAASFDAPPGQWFSVLQSLAVHNVEGVLARIRAYFAAIGQPSPFDRPEPVDRSV